MSHQRIPFQEADHQFDELHTKTVNFSNLADSQAIWRDEHRASSVDNHFYRSTNPEIRPTQSFVVPMTHQPTNNSKFDYSNRFSFRHNASEIFLNAADFKKDLQRLQINLVKVQTENTVLRQQIDTYTTSFHRIRQEALMSRQRVQNNQESQQYKWSIDQYNSFTDIHNWTLQGQASYLSHWNKPIRSASDACESHGRQIRELKIYIQKIERERLFFQNQLSKREKDFSLRIREIEESSRVEITHWQKEVTVISNNYTKEIYQLREQIITISQGIKDYQRTIATYQSREKQYQYQLQSTQNSISHLEDIVRKLNQGKCNDSSHLQIIQDLQDDVNNYQVQINNYFQQVNVYKVEINKYETEIQKYELEINNYTVQIQSLKQQLVEYKNDASNPQNSHPSNPDHSHEDHSHPGHSHEDYSHEEHSHQIDMLQNQIQELYQDNQRAVDHYQQQITLFQRDIDHLTMNNAQLTTQIYNLNLIIQNLKQNHHSSQSQDTEYLQWLTRQVSYWWLRSETRGEEILRLNQQKRPNPDSSKPDTGLEERVNSLLKQNSELFQHLEEAQNYILELQQLLNNNSTNQNCKHHQSEIKSLTEKLARSQAEQQKLVLEISSLNKQIQVLQQRLQTENSQLIQQIESYRSLELKWKKQETQYTLKITELEQHLHKAEEYIYTFQSKYSQFIGFGGIDGFNLIINESNDLKKKLFENEQNLIIWRTQIADYESSALIYKSRIQEFQQNITIYTTRIRQFQQNINLYKTKVTQYQQNISIHKTTIHTLQTTINSYKLTINQYELQIRNFETQIKDFNRTITDLKNGTGQISSEVNARITKLEGENRGYLEQIKILQIEITKYSLIIKEIEIYKVRITEYETQILRLKNLVSSSSSGKQNELKIALLSQEVQRLNTLLKQFQNKYTVSELELKALKAALEEAVGQSNQSKLVDQFGYKVAQKSLQVVILLAEIERLKFVSKDLSEHLLMAQNYIRDMEHKLMFKKGVADQGDSTRIRELQSELAQLHLALRLAEDHIGKIQSNKSIQ